ncbi:MAG: hypothetical protein KGI38_00155 [Thaumarchaeota archaeon]|nr:hypothetical protein [Nitrososphaerota archaeon]
MPACKHEALGHVGEQKTDEGVNSYYRCKSCGMLLVMTPSRQIIGIPGVQSGHSSSEPGY